MTNTLSELFSIEDRVAIDNNKPVLLIDGNNIVYRTLYSIMFKNPEENDTGFYLWRHTFLNNIINTIVKFNSSKVILAFDSKNSWRYDYLPTYKSNRKKSRDKSVVDFDKFFPILDEFRSDVKDIFSTIHLMDHPRSEADDIIAVLTKQQFKKNQNIIVSSDSDFHQLLIDKNNQQYDPMLNAIVKCLNPKAELDMKIIGGDTSDTIPAIKPRTGKVGSAKILREGIDDFIEKEGHEEYKKNYIRNQIMIDFNFIPKNISDGIIESYINYGIKDMDGSKLMKFFAKHKLNRLMSDWQGISSAIKSLK